MAHRERGKAQLALRQDGQVAVAHVLAACSEWGQDASANNRSRSDGSQHKLLQTIHLDKEENKIPISCSSKE